MKSYAWCPPSRGRIAGADLAQEAAGAAAWAEVDVRQAEAVGNALLLDQEVDDRPTSGNRAGWTLRDGEVRGVVARKADARVGS